MCTKVCNAAGHLQFTDAKGGVAWAWDKFCGGGAITHAGKAENKKGQKNRFFLWRRWVKQFGLSVIKNLKREQAGQASVYWKLWVVGLIFHCLRGFPFLFVATNKTPPNYLHPYVC